MIKIIIAYQLMTFLLVSCSSTQKQAPYAGVEQTETPSKSINEFAFETNKIKIKSLIVEDIQAKEAVPRTKKSHNSNFLDRKMNRDVKKWIKFFTQKDRQRFLRFVNNGQKYRVSIERLLTHYGLPKELFFVGFIESGYYLGANSRAKAVGPWQFIRATAKRYGLKINRYEDERRNLLKSTVAAAKYFKDLYNIFGSWELALSAYNAGEYGVIRRIRKANSRDYYTLSRKKVLPPETRNYVPKVLAVWHIYENADRYGLQIKNISSDYFTNVDVKRVYGRTSLKYLSQKYGWDYKRIKTLNAQFKRNIIPYSRQGHEIIYHSKNKSTSERKLQKIAHSRSPNYKTNSKKRVSLKTQTYKVKRGDNLTLIAKKFKTTPRQIKRTNNLRKSKIYPGQKLKIKKGKSKFYVVKKGDNLTNIAKDLNLRVHDLKKHNKIKNGKIYPGQRLLLVSNK